MVNSSAQLASRAWRNLRTRQRVAPASRPGNVRGPRAGRLWPRRCGRLIDGAGLALVRDHEDDDLHRLVLTRIARNRVQRPRRLIKRVARLQRAYRAAIDAEFIGALDHIAERVVARMTVRRT